MKLKVFYSLLLIIVFSTTATAQDYEHVQLPDKDSLLVKMLKAHRIYQAAGIAHLKKIKATKGVQSLSYVTAQKAQSQIVEQRNIMNTLLNNMGDMPMTESDKAQSLITAYINDAKRLEPFKSRITATQMKTMETQFRHNKKEIESKLLQPDELVTDTLPKSSTPVNIKVKNSLRLDLKFGGTAPEKNYIVYLFPRWWLFDKSSLAALYESDWNNLKSCQRVLDNFAFRWQKGEAKRWNNIPGGRYVVLIVDRTVMKVIYHRDLFIPDPENSFEYDFNE